VCRGFAQKGVTLDLEEKEPGIGCAAASVRNGSVAIVAAISISATNPYMPTEGIRALYVTREGAVSARHLKETRLLRSISTQLTKRAVDEGATEQERCRRPGLFQTSRLVWSLHSQLPAPQHQGALLLAPRFSLGSHLAMSGTMIYMLILLA
jgi:hypothetical protein